jgi:hypothetical protein
MPPHARVDGPKASDVIFSFRPEPTFSKTFSPLLAGFLVAIVAFSLIGFSRDGNVSLLLLSIGSGVAVAALLYGLTLLVDRAQASAHLEVLSDGTLIFRNAVGRVRRIGLRGAREVSARDLKGAPGRGSAGSPTLMRRLSRRSSFGPKLTQVRIRDENGKKLYFVVSGQIPRRELDRFYEIAESFRRL